MRDRGDVLQDDGIAYLYGEITKRDEAARTVAGYVSSPDVDLDGQIVDQEWLKRELPPWLTRYGNVREQHDPRRAVGKAQDVDLMATPGPLLTARIVDDDAWEKVKAGVYNGFSIGIKGPVVVRDERARNGRIVGGKLVEISIVDRPANDAARFVLVKRLDGGHGEEWKDVQTGAVIAAEGVNGGPPEAAVAKRDVGEQERARLAGEGKALPDGSFPIADVEDLRNAIESVGRAKDPMAARALIVRRARELGREDVLPDDWREGAEAQPEKAAMAAEAGPVEEATGVQRPERLGSALVTVLREALGRLEALVGEVEAPMESERATEGMAPRAEDSPSSPAVVGRERLEVAFAAAPDVAKRLEATARELAALKAAVAEQQAELERVKALARPVKGAVFAVEKGIGLEADRASRVDGEASARDTVAWLAEKAARLSEEERLELARAMYRAGAGR